MKTKSIDRDPNKAYLHIIRKKEKPPKISYEKYITDVKKMDLKRGDLLDRDHGYRNDGFMIYDGQKFVDLYYKCEFGYGVIPPEFKAITDFPLTYWIDALPYNTGSVFIEAKKLYKLIKNAKCVENKEGLVKKITYGDVKYTFIYSPHAFREKRYLLDDIKHRKTIDEHDKKYLSYELPDGDEIFKKMFKKKLLRLNYFEPEMDDEYLDVTHNVLYYLANDLEIDQSKEFAKKKSTCLFEFNNIVKTIDELQKVEEDLNKKIKDTRCAIFALQNSINDLKRYYNDED